MHRARRGSSGRLWAYQYLHQAWQNKPFVTTTLSTKVGAFEFWLQKLPGGSQLQLRYQLVWH